MIEDLYTKYGGYYLSPNLYPGGWVNKKTGERVEDESRKYFVDIIRKDLNKTKTFMKELATIFKQECIRFEYEGKVDYIPGDTKK